MAGSLSTCPSTYGINYNPQNFTKHYYSSFKTGFIFREIIAIDIVESRFSVKYEIIRKWHDPSLKFINLKEKGNILKPELVEKIFLPNLVFFNIENVKMYSHLGRLEI